MTFRRARPLAALQRRVLFALVMAAVVVGAAGAASADVLVSNSGRADSGSRRVDTKDYSQRFGTGTHTGGYNLESVVLDVSSAPTGTGTLTVTVRADVSGSPAAAALHTLTNPGTISSGLNEFTAPTGATLEANKTYHVVASYSVNSGGPSWRRTLLSKGVDPNPADGWSINKPILIKHKGTTNTNDHRLEPMPIAADKPLSRLRGRPGGGPLPRQRERQAKPGKGARHAERPSPNPSRRAGGEHDVTPPT